MRFQEILVGIDFGRASLAALGHAVTLAPPDGGLWLLHVAPDAPSRASERVARHETVDPADRLEQLAATFRARTGHRIEAKVTLGERPAEAIVRASEWLGVDAIVLGSRSQGIAPWIGGSVPEEVARLGAIPTLAVRDGPHSAASERPIRRVLLAVDRDPCSTEAARVGVSLARQIGAKVEAVHVVPSVVLPATRGVALDFPIHDLTPHMEDPASIAREIVSALGEEVNVRFLVGAAASEIVRYARPDDLIVCGRHARRGALARLVFGSVARQLLRRAPCAVLVVSPADRPGATRRDEHAMSA